MGPAIRRDFPGSDFCVGLWNKRWFTKHLVVLGPFPLQLVAAVGFASSLWTENYHCGQSIITVGAALDFEWEIPSAGECRGHELPL